MLDPSPRMRFELEMIARRLGDVRRASIQHRQPLDAFLSRDGVTWEPLRVGDRWGGPWQTEQVRIPFTVPSGWEGKLVAHVDLSERNEITGPESMAYLDGRPFQGVDQWHTDILLDGAVRPGGTHELRLEAFSSRMQFRPTVTALELLNIDDEVDGLYHDLRVLLGVARALPLESIDRAHIAYTLEIAYRKLDLRLPGSATFLDSVRQVRDYLRREVFERDCNEYQPRIVSVGHAHIDLAWLFPVAQTRRKAARTFSTVLRLMDLYPEYHFTASQPPLYEFVRDDEPELYGRILERVREGRFNPSGATYVEMDCNIPSGESLVRQFLFGKRFFREELGVDARVLWLPDVFGYSAALPQIMAGAEVDSFMTTKISWNEYNRIPNDTFRWRGIDGTEVLTHMVTAPSEPGMQSPPSMPQMYTYNAKMTPEEATGNWTAYRQKTINDEILYLFGWGDGGGGPTAEMEETAIRLAGISGFPHIRQGDPEAFFERLRERVWTNPDLPTWVGELYLEYHRGTYTSQAWIKRANRKSEILLHDAELWTSLAGLIQRGVNTGDRQREINAAWRTLLFNQFHDILPGSSIHQVYEDARRDFASIAATGEGVVSGAIADIAPASPAGDTIAVFNPAPFDRADPVLVRADAPLPPGAAQDLGDGTYLVDAPAPPNGLALHSLDRLDAGSPENLKIGERMLENRFFRLELGDDATITRLLDKRTGREVIAEGERGNRLLAFEDRPLNFDAWDIQLSFNYKPYPVDDLASLRVVEDGPLRGGVEIVRRYGNSTIRQRILLYRDLPRIDFPTEVDWHERQTLLKVAFPVRVNAQRATYDIQFGNVERPTHWNTSWDWARFETVAHKWVDLSEGDYGVSLLNDCKYGHDIKDHTIRLTLIKSPISPDPEADQGTHVFSYALLPHAGDWRAGETVQHAYLFNMPATGIRTERSAVTSFPGDDSTGPISLARTDRPGLVIDTIKPVEDGDGLIVRVVEEHNSRGTARVQLPRPIVSAEETNLLERNLGPVRFEGRDLHIEVRPYGIGTYRVRLEGE
jgi:alpha-mannosidase